MRNAVKIKRMNGIVWFSSGSVSSGTAWGWNSSCVHRTACSVGEQVHLEAKRASSLAQGHTSRWWLLDGFIGSFCCGLKRGHRCVLISKIYISIWAITTEDLKTGILTRQVVPFGQTADANKSLPGKKDLLQDRSWLHRKRFSKIFFFFGLSASV